MFKKDNKTRNKKILIIEDEEYIVSMYKAKLEMSDYDILTVNNGADGLTTAEKEMPDLILLDVIMPQLDGFSVLGELKKNNKTKKIPVILLTNLGTSEDIKKGKSLGADDYLVKTNLTPAQVAEKIEEYLNR